MEDFTINTFEKLIKELASHSFLFQTVNDFLSDSSKKTIILRHDVDRRPKNSLDFAKIQKELNIRGTYYFRIVEKSFHPEIIKEISSLGHEIGYHYETMATSKGDIDKAYDEFCKNLDIFRKIVPVTTICMHGSPLSKYDNRDIWKKYDYRKLGIIGEPYFDIDFNEVLYLTDTGRCWDGERFSVRDKIVGSRQSAVNSQYSTPTTNHQPPITNRFHSTFDIITAAENGELPDKIMFTFHPQRWSDKPLPWLKELIWQNLKNQVKGGLIRLRD